MYNFNKQLLMGGETLSMSDENETLEEKNSEAEAQKDTSIPESDEKARQKQEEDEEKTKRKRITRLFPALSYEECLSLGSAIWEFASGQKIRRLTLFDQIGKSPESGPSRTLITASNKYGVIEGTTRSEYIELSVNGSIATNPESTEYERAKANFELAIKSNEYLLAIYNQYQEMKVPSRQVIMGFLGEKGLDLDNQQRCVELFLVNAKFIGLIKVLSGTERLISIEHQLEDIGASQKSTTPAGATSLSVESKISVDVPEKKANDSPSENKWDGVCFYITPIGAEGSEQRMHADLFMGSIVEPAVTELGLEIVRSDTINAAGTITSQIIEHLVKAKLVVADLSFHNPNVFYELSLRHSLGKPVIHLIRSSDSIPFDIHSFRTIKIDDSSIYTFVPQIESYKTAVLAQARQLLESDGLFDNPITAFLNKDK